MTKSPEQLDEFIRRTQNHGDVSDWTKRPEHTGLVNIVSILNNIPRADVPKANLLRVRTRVLDKISLPKDLEDGKYAAFFRALPRFVRVTGGIVGAFTIALSLTIGTAVAALESVPGQTIYPIKRMVENVQLKLASDQEQKTNLQIRFANNRVDELEVILQKQKEGKASDEEVQKVVDDTVKDIQDTSAAVADQSKDQPQVALLTKIVSLTDKQTAVIVAAQADQTEATETTVDLDSALQATKTAKELAIENIERAGLVVEAQPMTIVDPKDQEDTVTAEGKLTQVSEGSVSIGSAEFFLTEDTEYANITHVDLTVGRVVEITGETKGSRTYAVKITAQQVTGQPQAEQPDGTDPDSGEGQSQTGSSNPPQTVPAVPQ